MTSDFLAAISIAVIASSLAIMLANLFWRGWDVLSWRNVMLLGFVYFQALSAYMLSRGVPSGVPLNGSGMGTLAVALALFFVVFMAAAWVGRRNQLLSRAVPRVELPATSLGLLITITVVLVLALVMAFAVERSYTAGLAAKFRGSLAAAATALATCYVFARRFNPFAWVLCGITLVLAVLISMVGHPGRRSALGVFMVIPWVLYFLSWRYKRPSGLVARVAVGATLAVLAVVIYSPVRFLVSTESTLEARKEQVVKLIENPFGGVTGRMLGEMLYSDAAPNSLFIVENYPDAFPHQPAAALLWMVVNPIPRSYWLEKPEALGLILQRQMRAGGNLGPGFIGHGWYEGGYIGVFLHAVFFGLLVGAVDRALLHRGHNPYFLALTGCYLGNIFAMPRGDIGLFLVEVLSGMFGVAVVFWGILLVFGPIARAFPPLFAQVDEPSTNFDPDRDGTPDETSDEVSALETVSSLPDTAGHPHQF